MTIHFGFILTAVAYWTEDILDSIWHIAAFPLGLMLYIAEESGVLLLSKIRLRKVRRCEAPSKDDRQRNRPQPGSCPLPQAKDGAPSRETRRGGLLV